MRKLAIAGVVLFGFVAAAWSEDAVKAPDRLEGYIPSDAILCVHYQGFAKAASAFKDTDLMKIINEPEVQEFGAELSRFMDALLKEKAEDSPVQWGDVRLLLDSESAFALLDVRGMVPSMVLVVRGGGNADALAKIVDRVIDKLTGGDAGAVAATDVDGVRCRQVGPMSFAVVSGDVIVTPGPETLRRVIRTLKGASDSMLKNALYAASAKKFGADREFVTAFFNADRFAAIMKDQKAQDAAEFQQGWKASGMSDVSYVRLAIAPDAPGVKVTLYAHAPRGAKGALAILPVRPLDEKSMLASVPETADDFYIARWDPAGAYDAITEMVAAGGGRGDFDAAIADFNQSAGFDLRKDLIGSLGDEVSLRTMGPGVLFLPEYCITLGVKDEKKLADCLDKLAVVAGRALEKDHYSLEPERVQYKGNTLVALKFVGLPLPMTPSYAIAKGKMTVAMTLQSLKKSLDLQGAAPNRPMIDSAAYAALRRHVAAKPGMLAYSEVRAGFDGLYGGLATSLVQMTNGIPNVPKHSLATKFPTTGAILPHLDGSILALSFDGEGYLFESYGTFGGGMVPGNSSSVATTGMMAGMLLPALGKAQEAARRASCMNNIRQIGLAMFQYAGDHDDAFPESFGVLLHDGYLTTAKVFFCPSDRRTYRFDLADFKNTDVAVIDKNLAAILSYVKVPGINHAADAGTIVLYEKDGAHGREGRNCFFNDGHVEWVFEGRFQRIMAQQKERLGGNN